MSVDVYYRETALLGPATNMLCDQHIYLARRGSQTSPRIARQLVDAFSSRTANLANELGCRQEPDCRSRVSKQRRYVFRKETSSLSDDRPRVCHFQQVIDDYGKAILRPRCYCLRCHLHGTPQYPALVHRHSHEADKVRSTLGNAAIDMQWFLSIEVVRPQGIRLGKEPGCRGLAGAHRAADPEYVFQSLPDVIASRLCHPRP